MTFVSWPWNMVFWGTAYFCDVSLGVGTMLLKETSRKAAQCTECSQRWVWVWVLEVWNVVSLSTLAAWVWTGICHSVELGSGECWVY